MVIRQRIADGLNKPLVYKLLIMGVVLSALTGFYLGSKEVFGDAAGYWNMSKSFDHGVFSSWYFLPVKTPETLRTWGYPFILYLSQKIYDSQTTIKIIQLLMHFASLWMALRIIRYFTPELLYRNIFLLIVIPNIQLAYYTSQVASESSTIFFLTLYIYVWLLSKENWTKILSLALLGFIIFQLKPVFLLFPFLVLGYKIIFNRKHLALYFASVVLFALSLLPFGFWNKNNHGIFKLTPLEGGAGAAHMGFWTFKLPDNYVIRTYWVQRFTGDMTRPEFFSEERKKQYTIQFEQEWKDMLKEIQPYFTAEDSLRIQLMQKDLRGQFLIYSGVYTQAREKQMTKKLIEHIKAEPWYYIKTRVYTFFRMWYTGVNPSNYKKASLTGKLALLFPFVVTFIFILGGLIFSFISLLTKRLSWKQYGPVFLLLIFFGIAHIPFVIQSRYLVPVHIFVLLLSASAVGNWLMKRRPGQLS